MSTPNRADLINTTYKVLKKHYKPWKPPTERTVIEHLLYGCLLENARPESADEALARLQHAYFDLNEIRVTSLNELAEVLSVLPDPNESAARLKSTLQSIFETFYLFDLEALKKDTLGKAVEKLEKLKGPTPFTVAFVSQQALGGHSIPTSPGVVDAMFIVGVVNESEAKKGRVPGLERTISKPKGCEFGSLLHQLGADYFAAPTGSKVRAILLEISPDAKDRLARLEEIKSDELKKKKAQSAKPKTAAKPVSPATAAPAAAAANKMSAPTAAKPATAPPPASKPAAAKPADAKPPAAKKKDKPEEAAKSAAKKAPSGGEPKKKSADPKTPESKSPEAKSASKQLTRKKPR